MKYYNSELWIESGLLEETVNLNMKHEGTYILDYTNKADGAALSNVVLSASQDERWGHHYVQVEVMRDCSTTSRHLQGKFILYTSDNTWYTFRHKKGYATKFQYWWLNTVMSLQHD